MKKNSNASLKNFPEKKYKLENLKVEEIQKLKTILTLQSANSINTNRGCLFKKNS